MTKSKLRLQDLLNKCDESIPMSKENKEWDEIQAVGKEYGTETKRGKINRISGR